MRKCWYASPKILRPFTIHFTYRFHSFKFFDGERMGSRELPFPNSVDLMLFYFMPGTQLSARMCSE